MSREGRRAGEADVEAGRMVGRCSEGREARDRDAKAVSRRSVFETSLRVENCRLDREMASGLGEL